MAPSIRRVLVPHSIARACRWPVFRGILATALALSCGDPTGPGTGSGGGTGGSGGGGSQTVASVTIDRISDTLMVGGVRQLAATVRTASGVAVSGRTVTWSTSNAAIATVGASTGSVAAVAPGAAVISATADGRSGIATITVLEPVAMVRVTPTTRVLAIGGSQQLAAAPVNAAGTPLTGRRVSWTSSNAAVASVDSTGLVLAIANGDATISATSDGKAGTAAIKVEPTVATVAVTPASLALSAGTTRLLAFVALAANGDTIRGRTAVWSGGSAAIATVNETTGLVTGVGVGTTSVRVTVDTNTASATVTVHPPVASVTITPNPADVGMGASAQLNTTVRTTAGTVVTGRAIAWRSLDSSIVTVDSTGTIRGAAIGTSRVVATVEGKSDSATVTVKPAVVTLRVVPDTITIGLGLSRTFTTVALAANADTLTGRTSTWSSSDSTVASVLGGVVTARRLGVATITARMDGSTATAHVTVAPRVATVEIPTYLLVPIGTPVKPTARLLDAQGNVVTGRDILWQSFNSTIVTVDATGSFRGVVPGVTAADAQVDGVRSNQMRVDVIPTPVASISVTPNPLVVERYASVQLETTPRDAAGNPLVDRVVTYVSSRPGYAQVSSTGLVTGVFPDTATITVLSGDAQTKVPVRVEVPRPVARIAVLPTPATVRMYESLQLSAVFLGAAGDTLPVRAVTWTSSNPAVATIAGGAVTPKALGSTTITVTSAADGKSGTATLFVTAPVPVDTVRVEPVSLRLVRGTSAVLAASPFDAAGAALQGRPLTWTTSSAQVATVGLAGEVKAVAPGSATITVSTGGKSTRVPVTVVLPAPVARVVVVPDSGTVELGRTVQLQATPLDSAGTPLQGRQVAWTSSDATRATVSVTGLVTARALGAVTLTATSEGKAGTSAITVVAARVASISIAPTPASVAVQDSLLLTATLKDGAGTTLTGRTVTWSVDSPTIAMLLRPGVVRGVALGTTTVTATSEGISATVQLTVTPPTVARVVIEPDPVVTFVGLDATLDTRVWGSNGQQLTNRVVTYATGDSRIATVTGSGIVRGIAVGATMLTATSEGRSDTTEIFVESLDVDTLLIAPANPTIMKDQQVQFTAQAYNVEGSLLPPRTVTWESMATWIGYPMNTTGLYYGREGGKVGIIARHTRANGTIARGYTDLTVLVQPEQVAEVLVQPNPVSLNVGYSQQLTVLPLNASRQVIYGLAASGFSSDNTSVATVSAGGRVTAVGAGSTKVWATVNGTRGFTTVNVTGTGTGGGGGSGGGGGAGGGGGSGGTVCNSTVSLSTPAPGQTSAWIRLPYPRNLEVRVRSSRTNHGTASAPKYEYFFSFRNGYADDLFFSYGASTSKVATSTTYAVSVAGGAIESEPSIYGAPGTLSLYVAGARLGSFGATVFCE